jgi:hypothetical protein
MTATQAATPPRRLSTSGFNSSKARAQLGHQKNGNRSDFVFPESSI